MTKQVNFEPFTHRGEKRIAIKFANVPELNQRVRKLDGVKWSQTQKCWHVADTEENRARFKMNTNLEALPPTRIDPAPPPPIESNISKEENNKPTSTELKPKPTAEGTVSIHIFARSIAIKLPKNDVDTQYLLSFRYSRWDKKQFCWIVPNYLNTLDLLKTYFKDRIQELKIEEQPKLETVPVHQPAKDELILVKTPTGRLKLYFNFSRELSKAIKTLPYHHWNQDGRYWTIPYSERFRTEIETLAKALHYTINYIEENPDSDKKARTSVYDIENYKTCPEEYILKLQELRYSESTLKTYRNAFEEFINYYNALDTASLDETQIVAFMRYLVIQRKVSTSYQNQAINAIKFYFERVLGGQRKLYVIDRPREEKKLPTVLNETEVANLLRKTENLKHKTILSICYSGGLRIGELVNLKIKDIDSTRMQIRIEQSKGKKDRYTLLSPKNAYAFKNLYIRTQTKA